MRCRHSGPAPFVTGSPIRLSRSIKPGEPAHAASEDFCKWNDFAGNGRAESGEPVTNGAAPVTRSGMPTTCCCVPGCSNRGGFLFPKDPLLQRKWLVAIRRSDDVNPSKMWKPSKHSVVCYAHFQPGDFRKITSSGFITQRKHRKDDAVPSVFMWKSSTLTDERKVRLECRQSRKRTFEKTESASTECGIDYSVEHVGEVAAEVIIDNGMEDNRNEPVVEAVCQANNKPVNEASQTDKYPLLSIENIMFNDQLVLFYTGLANYSIFTCVLACLGPSSYELRYLYSNVDSSTLSVENQLLLTLVKLRQHKTHFELAFLFRISEKTVTNIWITWINFMFRQWSELPSWPERELVRYFCPTDFKAKFPSTRVIIDGTECPVQRPRHPLAQQATYSTYKNRNTIKILVGCTPGGLVSYLSPAYGGSTSDRQIVERSSLMVLCDPGDSIMADKGFNVQDLFAPRDVCINIPTFFSRKNRMCYKTVIRDRKISSKRVHIERIIGLAKTFKILTVPLNSAETKLATEITTVCFFLCKFKTCIVPATG